MLETVQILLVIINIQGGTPVTVPMLDAEQCVASANHFNNSMRNSVTRIGQATCIKAKR